MPFVGLGLHFLVAIYFAVHALRTGQNMYWLIILFSFPLLGSVVYFVVVYLPGSKLESGARKVAKVAAKAMDPGRELRAARDAFDYTPTAQNQMRLAAALLDAGSPAEAATHYEACLKGPFASDPEIRLGAARAFVDCHRYDQALVHLESIRAADPNYRAEALALLMARALAGAGRTDQARTEYQAAAQRFGSFEVRAEYAIWLTQSGDVSARAVKAEIDKDTQRWPRHTRELNAALLRRLESAFDKLGMGA